ncbi:hypothetical protein FKW77_003198 [Venturia effusa]|uniref:Major facilitator superfamily (MFS) profile domain-containing protein n=1 Tax=Venturia effusa TaxID=50376 RepID=A0A517L6Z6_9PEZI|nr:hypothetical protein FKW77_003198 [Venturia effusa]
MIQAGKSFFAKGKLPMKRFEECHVSTRSNGVADVAVSLSQLVEVSKGVALKMVHGRDVLDGWSDGFIFGIVVPIFPFILQSKALVPADKRKLNHDLRDRLFFDFYEKRKSHPNLRDKIVGDAVYASTLPAVFHIDLNANILCPTSFAPWYAGLFLIIAGTIVFAIIDSFWTFVVSRLLQGASSAILYTVGLAVLVENVSKDEVGRYMGTAMSCNNFGMILSPLLGGIFYEKAGKYAVIGLIAGLSAIDITLRIMMKEQRPNANLVHEHITTSIEELGKAPASSSLYLPTITVSTIADASTEKLCTSPQTTSSGRLAGIYKLVRSPRLLTALYGCFVNECIVASLCAVLPLFVHQTFHWASLQAGCLFLAIAIPGLAGPLAGLLADKLGARWVAVGGFLLTTPSLVLMMLAKNDSVHDIVLLCVFLSLAGSSIIFFLSPLGADLSAVADEISVDTGMDMYASAFSLMNSALAAASIIGPLFVGWIQKEFGWTGTCVAMGAICLSGAIPCALFTGSRIGRISSTTDAHPRDGGGKE